MFVNLVSKRKSTDPKRIGLHLLCWFLCLMIVAIVGCEGKIGALPGHVQAGLPDPAETFDAECSSCHGDSMSPAPPTGLDGESATTDRAVGAHRSHLGEDSVWHGRIECGNCHIVPAETSSPGHIDGDNVAEVTFAALATSNGASPEWNTETCSNVYCHGATLSGGSLTTPTWTLVDGSQRACGTCHGYPPPAPHPQDESCGNCHSTMQPGSDTFLDPQRHINGVLDVGVQGQTCDSCHGSDGIAAPPLDLAGNTQSAAVGAHRVHLAASDWHREIACSNCHVVPVNVDDAGHIDGDNVAEVPFDALNPSASFNLGSATCSNLYCHGNGQSSNGTMIWTSTDPVECGSCHSTNAANSGQMSGRHQLHVQSKGVTCRECHNEVIDSGMNIINADLHINGQRNILFSGGGNWDSSARRCSNISCHGSKSW
ncbi:MAG: CxxxxCH/CxxCH domain-containing protein [Myxococcales bacterium]|nr:MAG: CxxxxCH/CxxCH domain-containing protein [Myxococcales bacterium]